MKRINITQAAAVIGVAGLFGIASLATAGDKKPAAKKAAPAITSTASLAKFDHVVVVNATPEQLAALAGTRSNSAVGMKAAVDPVTLQLRPVTAEDAAATAAPPAADTPVAITSPSGVEGFRLGESSMSYAVAHRTPDGKVQQACLDNQPSGKAALKAAEALKGADTHEK